MANYFFSISSGNNATGDGSQGNPWATFLGKADGKQFLTTADSCFFLCNDVWVAASAPVIVRSSGNTTSKIVLTAYGSGTLPTFCSANTTATGWVATGVSSIYTITNQTQTNLKVVTQDDNKALFRWTGANSGCPAGTFIRSGSTLFVHLWNDANPATSNVRIANFTHPQNGQRGMVCSSSANGAEGGYISFNSMKVLCINGIGFSSSNSSNYFNDCIATGCGQEGSLFYCDLVGSGENSDSGRWYRGEVSYSSANGGGSGQGASIYSSNCWYVDALVHDNCMAGIDFLDFSAQSNVTQCGALRCTVYDNGRWQDAQGTDPQIYTDGASEIYIYGCDFSGSGTTPGNAISRNGIFIGSEHADTKPAENIYVINNLGHKNHWVSINLANVFPSTTNNIKNIFIINNTIFNSLATTGFDMCIDWTNNDTSNKNLVIKNNVFIYNEAVNYFTNTGFYLDLNFNNYFYTNSSDRTYSQNGGSTFLTLGSWQGLTNQDLSSVISSPLIVLADDSNPDVHLRPGSKAIGLGTSNAFTPPAWLPVDLFPYGGGVRGIARSDGTVDLAGTDAGFHYLSGNNFGGFNTGLSIGNSKVTIARDSKLTLVAV